ncbi:hypothetical protein F4553_007090 [Allocatelliglobosispora scoriae]|uniref:Serine protease n=1 Tax=Allocatelliglobosispora scoriae TaxID=643052 RepID=A0A841C1B2_9ACTN|nr:hypothetical protein [Allocatelliglobosispora scoriae]MBB5873656.1 hypothetical protein [Allocatelliglobosispora scoriae]
MRLSQPVRASAAEWRAANEQMFAFLRGITVEFFGQTAGRRAANFTASGVVVRVTASGVDIVTAKHNLTMAAGDAPDPVAHFRARVRARLYDVNANLVDSPIASVHLLPHADVADGGYDAVVVRVTDPAFRRRVEGLVAAAGPGHAFRSAAYATEGWIIRPTSELQARSVLTNGHPYNGMEMADFAEFELVQMGYGKHQGDLFGFEHRVLPVTGLAGTLFVDQTHEGWEQVFTFTTDDTNTGASGDSGGPVFAVSPAVAGPLQSAAVPGQPPIPLRRSIALVGLHSGANYFADADDDPGEDGATLNNAITWVSERLALPA